MPKRMLRDWTDSETVNSLTVHAERLFVRLIMKADDYGRFHANPKLLKSFLFPLLVDTIRDADCSRWLAECEKAGLIRCYQDADAKPLLEIVNFGQRLRESRPKFPEPPATSGNSPQLAATSGNSPPEAGREEEARSGKREDERAADLVLPFASDQFREAWQDFVAMRAEIKKPLKPTAIKLSLAKLAAMGESIAIQSLKESTTNQWQGLFEPKPLTRNFQSENGDPRGNFAALAEHRRRKAELFGEPHEQAPAS